MGKKRRKKSDWKFGLRVHRWTKKKENQPYLIDPWSCQFFTGKYLSLMLLILVQFRILSFIHSFIHSFISDWLLSLVTIVLIDLFEIIFLPKKKENINARHSIEEKKTKALKLNKQDTDFLFVLLYYHYWKWNEKWLCLDFF